MSSRVNSPGLRSIRQQEQLCLERGCSWREVPVPLEPLPSQYMRAMAGAHWFTVTENTDGGFPRHSSVLNPVLLKIPRTVYKLYSSGP